MSLSQWLRSLVGAPVAPVEQAELAAAPQPVIEIATAAPDYTTTQLDELVRAGRAKVTGHHVLCSDGWYVNPKP